MFGHLSLVPHLLCLYSEPPKWIKTQDGGIKHSDNNPEKWSVFFRPLTVRNKLFIISWRQVTTNKLAWLLSTLFLSLKSIRASAFQCWSIKWTPFKLPCPVCSSSANTDYLFKVHDCCQSTYNPGQNAWATHSQHDYKHSLPRPSHSMLRECRSWNENQH